MSLKCLFGHKWNGCKCEKCGEERDKEHKWRYGTCEICGIVQMGLEPSQHIDEWLKNEEYNVPDFITRLLLKVTDVKVLVRYSYDLDQDIYDMFMSWAEDRLEDIAHGLNKQGHYDNKLANIEGLKQIIQNTRDEAKKANAENKIKDLKVKD